MPDQPFVEVRYGEVTFTPPPSPPKPRRTLSGWLLAALSACQIIFKGFAAIVGSVLLCLLLVIATREMMRTPVIIEIVSAPPTLAERGLTPEAFTNHLLHTVNGVEEASNTQFAQLDKLNGDKKLSRFTTETEQLDIAVPGSGLSLQDLVEMLRATLNLPQTRFSGEIICVATKCETDGLRLRLHSTRSGNRATLDFDLMGNPKDPDFFIPAALSVLETIDPYVTASYLFYNDENQWDRAETIARKLIHEDDENRFWAAQLLGNIQTWRGNPERGIEYYEQAIDFANEDVPENAAISLTAIGHRVFERGDYSGAIAKYTEATVVNPQYADAWNGWGLSLQKLDMDKVTREEQAADKFRHAIELDPQYADALNNLGLNYHNLGQHQKAIMQFERATDVDPSHLFAWYNWGNSHYDLKQYEQAAEKYERATNADPNFVDAWNNWGNSLGYLDRYEEAFQKYETSLSLDPEGALPASNWAYFFAQLMSQKDTKKCELAANYIPRFRVLTASLLAHDENAAVIESAFTTCATAHN